MKNQSSYSYRKNRFNGMVEEWKLNSVHPLMASYAPPGSILEELKFATMLYVSKASHFPFTLDEDKFIAALDDSRTSAGNITPNGAVVPKKEYQLEYNMVLRAWSRLVRGLIDLKPSLLSKFRYTPNIRVKFGEELSENVDRPLTTSFPHSDAWVEGPWAMNCYVPLFGDVKHNNLRFWVPRSENEFSDEFLNVASTYKEMQWVLDYYMEDSRLDPKKGRVHISDYALIHATHREKNAGTRVSIDTTLVIGEHEVHKDRGSEYLDEVKIIGQDLFVTTKRSELDQINDKVSVFSHYTTGNLALHGVE